MTIELTREHFAHLLRKRRLYDGTSWETVCTCGWLSKPWAAGDQHYDVCPHSGEPIAPKAEDWFPPTVGTHYAGQRIDPPVTTESIALAKAQRDQERLACERLTGVRILEDDTVVHPDR